jgi:hypothetical protein
MNRRAPTISPRAALTVNRRAPRGKGPTTLAQLDHLEGQNRARNEGLREERKRLVKMGVIRGSVRDDANERSEYLDKLIRRATGLE